MLNTWYKANVPWLANELRKLLVLDTLLPPSLPSLCSSISVCKKGQLVIVIPQAERLSSPAFQLACALAVSWISHESLRRVRPRWPLVFSLSLSLFLCLWVNVPHWNVQAMGMWQVSPFLSPSFPLPLYSFGTIRMATLAAMPSFPYLFVVVPAAAFLPVDVPQL